MGGIIGLLGRLFGKKVSGAPAEVYVGLRNQALCAEMLGGSDGGVPEVWGVVMEFGIGDGFATLVALADGTASLYLSHGGGVIGAGQHEGPANAARTLVRAAADYVEGFGPTSEFPLPGPGQTAFYLRTQHGALTVSAPTNDLGYNRHRLSPLFHTAHALIAEVRKWM